MEKQKINQNSWNNIAKSLLRKGLDVDLAIDWMEKRFELVSDEEIIEEKMKEAIQKGFITESEA